MPLQIMSYQTRSYHLFCSPFTFRSDICASARTQGDQERGATCGRCRNPACGCDGIESFHRSRFPRAYFVTKGLCWCLAIWLPGQGEPTWGSSEKGQARCCPNSNWGRSPNENEFFQRSNQLLCFFCGLSIEPCLWVKVFSHILWRTFIDMQSYG